MDLGARISPFRSLGLAAKVLSAIYRALLGCLSFIFNSLLRTTIQMWRVVPTTWLVLLFLQLALS